MHTECEHKEFLFSKLAPLGHLRFNVLVPPQKKHRTIKFLRGSWSCGREKKYGIAVLAFSPSAQMVSLDAEVWGI